jgi:hypothetical protein
MYAIRQIKHFSYSADKDARGQCVGEHFDSTGASALDIPLAVHLLISPEIEVFTTHCL